VKIKRTIKVSSGACQITQGGYAAKSCHASPAARRRRAFTLVEIMVVMGLLTVIVIGLMAMFDQTQKAFRAGMAQTDQLEGGRMLNDLVLRDMQQITPTYETNAMNFYAQIPPNYMPLLQWLPATDTNIYARTNILEDVFFTTRYNQTWSGIGYFVRTSGSVNTPATLVGTLYRFETNVPVAQFTGDAFQPFLSFLALPAPTVTNSVNVSKVLDGVVEFRVRAYDPQGFWLTNGSPSIESNRFVTITNSIEMPNPAAPGEVQYYGFSNNIVPAFVELEVGVLEPAVLKKYNSIPSPIIRSNFLASHAGNVQVFRQRVAIRNVDPSAYNSQ